MSGSLPQSAANGAARNILRASRRRTAGLRTSGSALIDTIAVLVVIFVLALVAIAWINAQNRRPNWVSCTNNLKQISVAARTWALDNKDAYPSFVPGTNGGAAEALAIGQVFRWFEVMSNELNTPLVVVCPNDTRSPATNFGRGFGNANVSYFVSLDAVDTNPQMIMIGDRNLTNGALAANRILVLNSNSVVGWSHTIHRFQGNVGLADGSVQQVSNTWWPKALIAEGVTNRIAMP